jgi:mono/diheme cytochrome c family protein
LYEGCQWCYNGWRAVTIVQFTLVQPDCCQLNNPALPYPINNVPLMFFIKRSALVCCLGIVSLFLTAPSASAEQPVRFNRDIRPILSDKCFACHGPAAKNSDVDLRLDTREAAMESEGVIVPGDPPASELFKRIFSVDEDEMMPPPETHKSLDAKERELLRRWIAEGAEYEPHWAYASLSRPSVPPLPAAQETTEAIDRFIGARLAEEKIQPAPEADHITLIRRLSFDLTGMPPTSAEVDAFVKDRSPDAYEKLVDRLLASPRYGERMAIYWLDLVRYADTVGYHGDQDVSQSPYRDYVIKAFNDNMPFDRFVREQLAGDLLPNATLAQRVASGYNRLNQTTEEGGSQAKEYLAIYFADRVRNVSQVFMGATMGCAQCHDHKFDPYTTRDFYSIGAFFADIEERGVYSARGRPPTIPVPTAEEQQQLAALDSQIEEMQKGLEPLRQQVLADQDKWEASARDLIKESQNSESVWIDDSQDAGGKSEGDWSFITAAQGPVHSGVKSRRQQSKELVQHYFDDANKKVSVTDDTRFFAWVYLDPKNPPQAIMLQFNDGSWDHRAVWGSDQIEFGRRPKDWAGYQRLGKLPATGKWVRLEVDAAKVGLKAGQSVKGMAFTQYGGLAYWDQAGWRAAQSLPEAVAAGLALPPDQRNAAQAKAVSDYYLSRAKPIIEHQRQLSDLQAKRKKLEGSFTQTVVSNPVTPRTIRILPRGNWMDDSGDIVQPAIPQFLGKLDTGDRRATRLDLANWLCEPENVLTSRTMANRLWFLMFGRGICTSVDDLGGQGTFPSNPDLLDWLAVEFVESGWDVKHLLRTIATSEAYRRSSKPTPELLAKDPYNDLFARQGRFLLAAEMVRDGALATSGLLVEQVGGRSTKPYQPAGYYAQLNFPKRKYVSDSGSNQYRRGVYTHWQRTFLHPMLKAFDAPSREECTASRSRSNTPLQALTLLNDPTFVEAARVYAARIMREGGETPEARIAWAYQTAVSRSPEETIVAALRQLYKSHLAHYRDHVEEAKKLIATGNAPTATDLDPVELAAWTSVARTILNLHETIMRY